jgi:hypothetical protein
MQLIQPWQAKIAQPTPEHQVLAARHDAYRIDLEAAHTPDFAQKISL